MSLSVLFIADGVSSTHNEYFISLSRLIDRYFQSDHMLYVVVNGDWLERVDRSLWTFKDMSFIPHTIMGTSPYISQIPVLIGSEVNMIGNRLCINTTVHNWLFSKGRVLEFVDDVHKSSFVKKYHYYRRLGYHVMVEKNHVAQQYS